MNFLRHSTWALQHGLKDLDTIIPRRVPVALQGRSFHTSHVLERESPLRVAIVGSGPAGFYAARKLQQRVRNTKIDMYEQLPVPYGLVRFGVAPDHPEVKNCEDSFVEVAQSPNFNFIGNVNIGHDLPLSVLKPHYDAILFAYGASKDRALGLKGENAPKHIYSARAFVGWYNGLPEYRNLEPDLEAGENAVIIGHGNVALDVARTLLTDVDVLRKTDMTDYALSTLSKSRIKNVDIVGRRGLLQAAYTTKEVRELFALPDTKFMPIPNDYFPNFIPNMPRKEKRMLQLLQKHSGLGDSRKKLKKEAIKMNRMFKMNITPPLKVEEPYSKTWSLKYLLSPVSLQWSPLEPADLTHVVCVRNKLVNPSYAFSPLLPRPDNPVHFSIPASTLFRSIGYTSEPLPGLTELGASFNSHSGTIANDGEGRVLGNKEFIANSSDSDNLTAVSIGLVPGLYCTGWVKSGPTGVIATTMEDAFAAAKAIVADWDEGAGSENMLRRGSSVDDGGGWEAVKQDAQAQGVRLGRRVSWKDWEKIDAEERERGRQKGKVREKFTSVQEMLDFLG